jgi:hypothetical protein
LTEFEENSYKVDHHFAVVTTECFLTNFTFCLPQFAFLLSLIFFPAAVAELLAEAAGSGWEDASSYPSHTKTFNWDSLPVREPLPH